MFLWDKSLEESLLSWQSCLTVCARQLGPPAPADQVGGGTRACEGLHLRGGLQADPREAGHRGCGQPAARLLEPADGAHQGDDGCAQSGEGGGQPETQILGPPQAGHLQG